MRKSNNKNVGIILTIVILFVMIGAFCFWLFDDLSGMTMDRQVIYSTDISTYQNVSFIESCKVALSKDEFLYCLEKHSYKLQHSGYIEYVFVIECNDIDSFMSGNDVLLSHFCPMDQKRNLIGGDVENTGYYVIGEKIFFHIANRKYADLTGIDSEYRLYCQELITNFELLFKTDF